jgi:hypothetical protein
LWKSIHLKKPLKSPMKTCLENNPPNPNPNHNPPPNLKPWEYNAHSMTFYILREIPITSTM